MQVSLFNLLNSSSKQTLDKLFSAKMKDAKAVYSMVKLARKMEQEDKNIAETVKRMLDEWDEYPALKAIIEQHEENMRNDPLLTAQVEEKYVTARTKINDFVNKGIDQLAKETVIDLAISLVKIDTLLDVGLTNAEVASVEWLVDFGETMEEN